MIKTTLGNYFEDFRLGQEIHHAAPRTVTKGDVALYTALYGSRFAFSSSDEFARAMGFPAAPIDDLLTFHMVFGKTVPDISLNALANLGYAEAVFGVPVYPDDTLRAVSRVIGLKENSNRQTGVVYVRSTGYNQRDEIVLEYCRWVMVKKKDPAAVISEQQIPDFHDHVPLSEIRCPLLSGSYPSSLSGSSAFWEDYHSGERIDHIDGMTIEEAEHMMATRLYQNTAKVHFNHHTESKGRFGRRLVYGGHVISMARALSFNGLANAFKIAAINGGRHVNPVFAGDTLYAWSEVLACHDLPARADIGALRLRLVAVKDRFCADFPLKTEDGAYDPSVVLDLDYTILMPKAAWAKAS